MESMIVAGRQVEDAVVRAAARTRHKRCSHEGAEGVGKTFDLKGDIVLGAAHSQHFAVGGANESAGGIDGAEAGLERPLKEFAEG
jgi:hypothetical protein